MVRRFGSMNFVMPVAVVSALFAVAGFTPTAAAEPVTPCAVGDVALEFKGAATVVMDFEYLLAKMLSDSGVVVVEEIENADSLLTGSVRAEEIGYGSGEKAIAHIETYVTVVLTEAESVQKIWCGKFEPSMDRTVRESAGRTSTWARANELVEALANACKESRRKEKTDADEAAGDRSRLREIRGDAVLTSQVGADPGHRHDSPGIEAGFVRRGPRDGRTVAKVDR